MARVTDAIAVVAGPEAPAGVPAGRGVAITALVPVAVDRRAEVTVGALARAVIAIARVVAGVTITAVRGGVVVAARRARCLAPAGWSRVHPAVRTTGGVEALAGRAEAAGLAGREVLLDHRAADRAVRERLAGTEPDMDLAVVAAGGRRAPQGPKVKETVRSWSIAVQEAAPIDRVAVLVAVAVESADSVAVPEIVLPVRLGRPTGGTRGDRAVAVARATKRAGRSPSPSPPTTLSLRRRGPRRTIREDPEATLVRPMTTARLPPLLRRGPATASRDHKSIRPPGCW